MNGPAAENAQYVSFPETYTRRMLNSLYREIPLKDTTSRSLRKYFNAMANLYGIIPLKKAYEIISEHNPSLVTEEKFLAFSEIARHECEDYLILGDDEIYTDGKTGSPFEREIIDVTLIGEDLDRYIQTKQSQQGKPYFIPEKKELLLYDDPFYCDTTPEVSALKRFLSDRLELNESQEAAVFVELLYGARSLDADVSEVMNRLFDMKIRFQSETDLHRFIALYQSFHNTTRMQCNRGYTPEELSQMQSSEERMPRSVSLGPNIQKAIADGTLDVNKLRREIMAMEMPNEELRDSILRDL